MCREMDQIYSEGAKRGRTEGIAEGIKVGEMKAKRETAFELAGMGLPAEKIAKAVKVNLETVKGWLSGASTVAK